MTASTQQQTYLQAGQQHLAMRQQADSDHPVVLVHQQQAMAEIQALEAQRLGLAEAALEAHLQTTWGQSAQAT